jgi:hypothetical protein
VAGDANTVEDIDQVRVAIVYTAAASDPTADPGETGNTQTLACLKWVKIDDAWTISSPSGVINYTFTVTAASANAGDTYTNNSATFTVLSTISGTTTLICSGTGAPLASGDLTRTFGTGTTPIVFSAFTSADATTWSITSGSCTKPSNMGLITGTWEFYFTVGKVATEAVGSHPNAGWDLFGEVKDEGDPVEAWGNTDLAMEWYGAVTVNNGTAAFGDVALGVDDDPSSPVSVTYISNGEYSEQVKSSSPWTATGGSVALNTSGTPTGGQFSLKADDDAIETGFAQVLTATFVSIAEDESLTLEAGDLTANNTLWLTLGSSAIPVGTYTGTVYFKIDSR